MGAAWPQKNPRRRLPEPRSGDAGEARRACEGGRTQPKADKDLQRSRWREANQDRATTSHRVAASLPPAERKVLVVRAC